MSSPTERAASAPRRLDPYLGGLLLLCILHLLFLARHLLYPDLNLDYPFVDGDSYDWIAGGLHLAGYAVRDAGRPPLLPLAIAGLTRLAALPLLPLLLEILFHGTILAFYAWLARLVRRPIAAAVALLLLVDFSLQSLALEVMADLPASCLLFLALRSFTAAGEPGDGERRPQRYLASGLWAGLSAVTQQAALLWPLPAALALWTLRRRDLRSPWLWGGGALFVLPQLAAFLLLRRAAGAAAAPFSRYLSLLAPHIGAVPFYLFALVSLLGLPACLLLLLGLVPTARRAARSAPHQLCLTLAAGLALFFVGVYGFSAKRLLVYLVWPAGLPLALGLSAVSAEGRSRRRFAVAAGLAILAAALPLPTAGQDATWAAVWPLPPVLGEARLATAPSGSPRLPLAPGALRWTTPPLDRLLGWSTPGRVVRERALVDGRRSVPRLDPASFAADRGALYLFDSPDENGGRYRTLTRLGNALRQKVKLVPRGEMLPYLPLLSVAPLGSLGDDYAVHRVRLPALPGSWLLVTRGDRPLAPAAPLASTTASAEAAARLAAAKAATIADFAHGSVYVALLTSRDRSDRSQLYLPFLLETTELYVVPEEEAARTLQDLARDPVLAETRFGDTLARRLVVLGKTATLIRYPPAAGAAEVPR